MSRQIITIGQSGTTFSDATTQPPPDGVLLFQEGFEDTNFAARGWYDNTAPVLSTAEHTPGSTRSAVYHWNVGTTTPPGGASMRKKFTPSETVYLSYWIKYSTNWIGSGQDYHPHEFHFLSTLDGDFDGPSDNWLCLYIEDNYQGGGIPRLEMQDNLAINASLGTPPHDLTTVTENRSVCGCNGLMEGPGVNSECFSASPWFNDKWFTAPGVRFNNNPGTAGYKNDWNFVEAYFKMNSIVGGKGVNDGIAQHWFNGVMDINRNDVIYRTGQAPRSTMKFQQFLIAPYIGDGSPANQFMWLDDIRVGTGRLP